MKSVVNGRASICTWELEFYFRDKDQIREFVKLLMKDEIDFDFEYEKVLGEIGEQHYITVKGSWANNLVRVAKLAAKVDYKDGH
jgi:hypothetical protein